MVWWTERLPINQKVSVSMPMSSRLLFSVYHAIHIGTLVVGDIWCRARPVTFKNYPDASALIPLWS